ncbi:MAG: hypothetical protein IPK39_03265 [Sulfuritalea sp.]|nr:hypothetical protein [Sulfuritalea sp.]
MAVTNKLEAIGRGGVCRDSEDGVFVPNDSPLNYFDSLGSRFERAFECIQSAIMHSAQLLQIAGTKFELRAAPRQDTV